MLLPQVRLLRCRQVPRDTQPLAPRTSSRAALPQVSAIVDFSASASCRICSLLASTQRRRETTFEWLLLMLLMLLLLRTQIVRESKRPELDQDDKVQPPLLLTAPEAPGKERTQPLKYLLAISVHPLGLLPHSQCIWCQFR